MRLVEDQKKRDLLRQRALLQPKEDEESGVLVDPGLAGRSPSVSSSG